MIFISENDKSLKLFIMTQNPVDDIAKNNWFI